MSREFAPKEPHRPARITQPLLQPQMAPPWSPHASGRLPSGEETLTALIAEVPEDDEDIFGNRVEWKYVLTNEVVAAIRGEVAKRLRLEEFIPGRKKTAMHSIYFDSKNFMLYNRAALSQQSLKFRLRTYTTHGNPDQMDRQCFFECKIGKKGKKFKLRSMLQVVRAGDLIVPHKLAHVGTGRLAIATDQRFLWKARRVLSEFKMQPRLTVSYVREAFVTEDGSLRITLDKDYKSARIDKGVQSPLDVGRGGLDVTIVEVKFVNALPTWLAELLAVHALPLGGVTFSKFRQGVALAYPEVAAAAAETRAKEAES